MALKTSLDLKLAATLETALDLSTVRDSLVYALSHVLPDGAGDGQANLLFHDRRTIAGAGGGTNDDLDLAGSLEDSFGGTLTFTAVKLLLIRADADNPAALEVGGATAGTVWAPWLADDSDKVSLAAGATLLLVAPAGAGYAVVPATDDILRIHNPNAADASYEIVLVGVGTTA